MRWLLLLIVCLTACAPATATPRTPSPTVAVRPTSATSLPQPTHTSAAPRTLAERLSTDPRFSRFAQLAQQTELWPALSDPAQRFTLFVPTNRALQALPAARLQKLETQAELRAFVLNYHATRGLVLAEDFSWIDAVENLAGDDLPLEVDADGLPTLGGFSITAASVPARNGAIFPLETVFWPLELMSLQEALEANPRLTELRRVAELAELSDVLNSAAPHTFFAPTNEAFAALTPEQTQRLADPATARKVLLYHLLQGHLTSIEAAITPWSTTLLELPVICTFSPTVWTVNDAQVLVRDIRVANGTLHLVNQVLFPPTDLGP